MNKRLILGVVAMVAIVVSVALIARRYVKPATKDVLGLGVVGEVAAEETSRLLNRNGQVAVIYFDVQGSGVRGMEKVLRGLEEKLGQSSRIKIVAKKTVAFDRQDQSQLAVEWVGQQAAADLVLLVGGLGVLQQEEFVKLRSPHPKLVSVLAFGPSVSRGLLSTGVLALAITDATRESDPKSQPRTARERFDAMFTVLAPAGEQ